MLKSSSHNLLLKDKLIEIILENCPALYQKELIPLIRPCIRMSTTQEPNIKKGQSKFGGLPDLPDSFDWPVSVYTQKPMPFLAQINLQAIKSFDEENLLPDKEILYFFSEFDCGKVLFYDGDINLLQRRNPPNNFELYEKRSLWQILFNRKGNSRIFKSCTLKFSTQYDFPSWDSYYIDQIAKNTKDIFSEKFHDKLENLIPNETQSHHHLLGYANAIQDGHLEPVSKKANPLDWILLFQIDSDDNTGMSWGDSGRIYFFIEKTALQKADFSNVYVTSDCY